MGKKNAFTLIELLVVIAIIALLMSVILPSLSKAKESARMVICGNNEKTLVMASKLWANDHQDFAVAGTWWKDERERRSDGTYEDCSEGTLTPYLASSRKTEGDSMTCPSAKNVRFEAVNPEYVTADQERRFTYASNGYMTYNNYDLSPGIISGPKYADVGSGGLTGPSGMYWTTRGATKIMTVKNPAKIVYFIDHEYYVAASWTFDPTLAIESFPAGWRFQTRWHKKKTGEDYGIGVIGWVDGHVSREPEDFAEKYTSGGATKKRWTAYFYGK